MTEKRLTKKIGAVVLAVALTLGLFATSTGITSIDAKADGVVSATVSYTAQYGGAFRGVEISSNVSSDAAENMGYEDNVPSAQNVSVLDVWVQIHKDLYPEYNINNKDEYFRVEPSDYGPRIVTAFHEETMSVGYRKNGTPTVLTDIMSNGDVLDVYHYQDTVNFTDMYAFFDDVSVENGYMEGTLRGNYYDNDEGDKNIPLDNVQIGWLDVDTLELIPASPFNVVVTDATGHFSVEMPSTSRTYMLTVYDGNYGNKPLVRSLYFREYPASSITTSPKTPEERLQSYTDTGRYIAENNKSIVYGDSKEGYLLGLGRSGQRVDANLYPGYYQSIKKQIASGNGYFDSVTECAKVVIALNAIGYDPTNIDGVNITTQLNDINSIEASNNKVYGYAYALIALDTKKYESSVRDQYINKLLEAQLESGAWGWNGTSADVDTTGIVLAALAPYYNNNPSVTAAVDKSLNYLSNVQAPSGAFASGLNENSNSTAMVVLALSELGIDAGSDSRFIKNGVSAVDALCSFAVKGGGFGWIGDEVVNDYATYQSYYALVAYYRHINGMNRLFDMTPEKADIPSKVPSVPKTGDKFFLGLFW